MKLILISAVSTDGVIGIGKDIPWKIPEDFQHYRDTTMGSLLVVGATTFQTLPPKAHEGREFMILNSGERFTPPRNNGYYQFRKLNTVLDLLQIKNVDTDKAYVIGGSSIYHLFIDYCDEAIITWVDIGFDDKSNAFMFPVEKLRNDFQQVDEPEWQKSRTGIWYKIQNHKRK